MIMVDLESNKNNIANGLTTEEIKVPSLWEG
jgi:hypothetical protein